MVKKNFFKFNKNFLIAEAGINHNGKLKTALKLVDVAKKSGADAVKFQTYITEKRVNKKHKKIFDILKRCELSHIEFKELNDYCIMKKITFFSTPFDIESVDFLESLKVKLYKIASFDIGNFELINRVILTKKPTIISTGMARLDEISKVYSIYRKNNIELAFLHCVSSYPNKDINSYLANIEFLKNKFKCPIGISDHTNDIKIPIYGNLLGANIIEKHLKINMKHKCVDSPVSITGSKFKELKNEIEKIILMKKKVVFGVRKEEKGTIIFKRKKIL